MIPVRTQRRRVKGWRMPPNTVSVTRPGRWGNPFVVGSDGVPTAEVAVDLFRRDIAERPDLREAARRELREESGVLLPNWRTLSCRCFAGDREWLTARPPRPLHARFYARIHA